MYQLHNGSLLNHIVGSELEVGCLLIRMISGSKKLRKKRGELQEHSELGKLPKPIIQNIIFIVQHTVHMKSIIHFQNTRILLFIIIKPKSDFHKSYLN